MNLNLSGKKALIFGASSGIGRGILELFYREGAEIVACSRDKKKLEQINKDKSPMIETIAADLSLEGDARRVTEKTIGLFGGLDILLYNTGGPPKGSFAEIGSTAWKQSIQNLWLSLIESIQIALPALQKNGEGRIILIASTSAKEPIENMVISNSLRAGLLGMMKTLSTEVARHGITVNVILPGFIDTARLAELGNSRDKMLEQIPMGHLGTVEDIAALALFLASKQAAYITGQMIAVDGGRLKGF